MGKSIRVYLVDGTASGIRTAEVVNWTGLILVAPRTRLADIGRRIETKGTGVYILVGDSDEGGSRKKIYVGEADSLIDRLKGHARNESKEFWTETILVTSKDPNVTKAHARFLESHLIRIAQQSGRAIVENGTLGTSIESITLPESDISDMTEFLEQVRLVLPVVGFDFLEPSFAARLSESQSEGTNAPIFELKQGKYRAKAREIDGKFVVLRGSLGRKKAQPSWTFFKNGRAELVRDGLLAESEDNDCLVFVEDVPFNSPSAASSAVLARNSNGRQMWKVADTNTPYQDWFLSQIEHEGS